MGLSIDLSTGNDVHYEIVEDLTKAQRGLVTTEWEKADRRLHGKDYDSYEWQGEGCVIAQLAGALVGIAKFAHEGGVLWLEELLVFESYRGQGVGTKLLQHIFDYAKEHRCHKITLETDERLEAVELYKKVGFEVEVVLKNHYAKKDAILMSTYLS